MFNDSNFIIRTQLIKVAPGFRQRVTFLIICSKFPIYSFEATERAAAYGHGILICWGLVDVNEWCFEE